MWHRTTRSGSLFNHPVRTPADHLLGMYHSCAVLASSNMYGRAPLRAESNGHWQGAIRRSWRLSGAISLNLTLHARQAVVLCKHSWHRLQYLPRQGAVTTLQNQFFIMQDVPIMLGDIQDQASIDQIAQQCNVVIATAGPFAHYGTAVVDACVRTGADYCDCTGSPRANAKVLLHACHKFMHNQATVPAHQAVICTHVVQHSANTVL